MIREFTIENFKSVESLTLPLGRVTVLIGENGAGKSNVLEGIAFLAAAAQSKLDPEFLYARGVRVTNGQIPLSSFKARSHDWKKHAFYVACSCSRPSLECSFTITDEQDGTRKRDSWAAIAGKPKNDGSKIIGLEIPADVLKRFEAQAGELISKRTSLKKNPEQHLLRAIALALTEKTAEERKAKKLFPSPFLIYSPENTALRSFEKEGQISPLGVRGEGLFRLVQRFASDSPERFQRLRHELKLFDWFEDFSISKRLGIGESRLDIKDRFLAAKRLLDQRSANEGFLFLLFYLCLFLSPQTPKFFAIDNIDASLNPKLCAEMMRRLVALAKQEDKQVVITTHNPAILDGLDLSDKEQMLYAIQRNEKGRTIAQRIPAPKPQPGEPTLKLSHAYLRGLLGGVPKNF